LDCQIDLLNHVAGWFSYQLSREARRPPDWRRAHDAVAPCGTEKRKHGRACGAAILSLEGSAVIADFVFRFRSISGGYGSLQWLSRALSTSRGRLAECSNRLQLTALIRESPRVDVSRPSRCSCPCGNSAARGRTGLSSSSTKASQIVRRASWRRRSARTDVSGRVRMDARIAQYG
jgi:hypothetical protein